MENVLLTLKNEKIVAVIRTTTAQKAIAAVKACIEGNIKIIEITFTIPNIEEVIKTIQTTYQKQTDIIIGAGTVINEELAQQAIAWGCQFIVGPNFNLAISKLCQAKKVLYIPGAMTITEMTNILANGWKLVKLFPGSCFSPDYIKAIKAPLPNIEIMPTGGVDEHNLQIWLKNGCLACGIGGNLINPIEKDDYLAVVNKAKEYVRLAQNI
ncbi:bifunctional 2-keto-4-hydroxyglutarate aldolase/2-keto-3-deoxy-6-phosphogluconate aldolase [Spiroplasma eriocheiris]|uniref:2-keto-3-deoxy-6-phosphogluconate aldolase n=1 Tax=Spiroplasma eriocheiris TaxID=315358 RepID=A0A0H3XJ48_9MOLU|nr:bifunctional 2-keto-4-hydroxyglutarate aldolase/2-keto-3-deoxy-6-phosphogluconate aldolase [Spiroplasma eriocheiris]AHF57370.1 keto-hydroxyglutarate-aldolase/keto-deoxy-phosphogluconate aldolase [Spiroplasma eriocheiris CCTCC M 207170]AKM53826.1 2-keto-3-deoxy-6-phosphogluconate aldolase [Spiroplasma eriocheiris]